MKRKDNFIVIAILVLSLVFTMIPVGGYAADNEAAETADPVTTGTDDPGTTVTTVYGDVQVSLTAKSRTYNSTILQWKTSDKATKYKIYRAESRNGKYRYIASVAKTKNQYINSGLKTNKAYYYKVYAVKAIEGNSELNSSNTATKAVPKMRTPASFKAALHGYSDKAKIKWSRNSDAQNYKIYRAVSKNGKYKLIKTCSSNTASYIDKNLKSRGVYYYKVCGARKISGKTYHSAFTSKKAAVVKYKVMGTSSATAQRLKNYFVRSGGKYPSYYKKHGGAKTLGEFCQIYVNECKAEGIKAEVAFVQAMLETGFLRFGGDVKASQYNFAGLGATGGVRGASFKSIKIGIRAQIQHLKAYASKKALNKKCVDKRFGYVTRGTSTYVEWLGMQENPHHGGWAASKNYGYILVKMIRNI